MRKRPEGRRRTPAGTAVLVVLTLAAALAIGACARSDADARGARQDSGGRGEPWTQSQTVEPAALAKELTSPRRPTVACVGFPTLYRGGHVPAAVFHGPASTPEGLADLKRWAAAVPKSTDVVLYCGCCPLDECPNVRPAFAALRDMGFTHVRLLLLPHNFATDWVDAGFPVER